MDVDDHFEDFTTASDWEHFTANIEQVLNEWQAKPVDTENIRNQWVVIHEKISMSEFPFKFSYYKKIQDPLEEASLAKSHDNRLLSTSMSASVSMSTSFQSSDPSMATYLNHAICSDVSEFPPKPSPHPIVENFCLQEFAVITSAALEPVNSEARLKVILSSASIALNNTNSVFPIFVQYHHWSQNYFYGIAESCGIRTSLQMVHLKSVPNHYTYLSGLLDIFKSKIGSNLSIPITLSAHFFYKMKAWHPEFTFMIETFDVIEFLKENSSRNLTSPEESSSDMEQGANDWNEFHAFTKFLPFGGLDDPFGSMKFVSGWPLLTENVVVDSSAYSDLEPNNAPDWFFGLTPDDQLEYRLQEMLEGICKLKTDVRSIEDVLGKKLESEPGDIQYMSALDRIAQRSPLPVASINRVIKNVNKAQKQLLFSPAQYTDLPPISQHDMDAIISFLFPDANPDHQFPYPATSDRMPSFEKEDLQQLLEALLGIKSAPLGGLVWRLAAMSSYVHAVVGASGALAHLWAEVILELRYRLENSILISGLERSAPNSGTCLLNQKLQMLNCCIERKLAREKKEKSSLEDESPGEESDDDEFFDAEDTLTTLGEGIARVNKPVGRLRKCGRLRLITTGEFMYIPNTQDPAPLTEDVLEEQAKMLVELGNDPEGSERRAKIMSASLTSDMQSFKAANPGAILEDFVRWYSPRDWIETEELDEYGNSSGYLSPRMKVPGNLWLEVWTNAQPIPARRQKRLFDDTKEAEKVLHWMSTRTLSEISQLLLPCLLHMTVLKILDEADKLPVNYKVAPNLPQTVSQWTRVIGQSVEDNSNNNSSTDIWNSYRSSVLSSISRCEKEISQLQSFIQKFPGLDLSGIYQSQSDKCASKILPEFIKIPGGPKSTLGQVIKLIFRKELEINQLVEHDQDVRFGDPVKKIFVLKYNPTNPNSNALPQRMSCCLKPDEFLLAGIFSGRTDLG